MAKRKRTNKDLQNIHTGGELSSGRVSSSYSTLVQIRDSLLPLVRRANDVDEYERLSNITLDTN